MNRAAPQRRLVSTLAMPLLLIAAVLATLTAPATGAFEPWPRVVAQIGLVIVTAALVLWTRRRRTTPIVYLVRGTLSLAAVSLNPLFAIFAWIGFTDAREAFARWGWLPAFGFTSIAMALGQSGGLPWRSPWQPVLFGLLVAVNFLLAYLVTRVAMTDERAAAEREATVNELKRVNADLRQALSDNSRLTETVSAHAHAAGIASERQRLAREIHDTTAQALAGVVAQLQATHDDADLTTARPRIARAEALARDALVDSRRSMHDLMPAQLTEASLVDALRDQLASWQRQQAAPAHVEITIDGEARPLHQELEATVLRIAQESLANIAKHADAGRVGLTLSYFDDEIALDIRDDGIGFDATAVPDSISFGLRGMRERSTRLSGVFQVESGDGAGTAISARFPAIERGAA